MSNGNLVCNLCDTRDGADAGAGNEVGSGHRVHQGAWYASKRKQEKGAAGWQLKPSYHAAATLQLHFARRNYLGDLLQHNDLRAAAAADQNPATAADVDNSIVRQPNPPFSYAAAFGPELLSGPV